MWLSLHLQKLSDANLNLLFGLRKCFNMQKFIKLTHTGQYPLTTEIYCNVEHIVSFYSTNPDYNKGTYVTMLDTEYSVKETPEEIRRLIFPRQQSFGPG